MLFTSEVGSAARAQKNRENTPEIEQTSLTILPAEAYQKIISLKLQLTEQGLVEGLHPCPALSFSVLATLSEGKNTWVATLKTLIPPAAECG